MRSRRDARIDRQVKQKAPSPAGGKVLRRLFAYLAERDPSLNSDVVRTLVIPKATVPRFGFPKSMSQAKAARTLAVSPRRSRSAPPAAKSFGAAIAKAATSLARAPRRRARARTGVAAPAAAAPMWQSIGPDHIPDGQTYGTNRVDVIGRLSSIAIDPGNTKHILLGSAGGGIWESKNSGTSWLPCTDKMPSLAIGAVAFDPDNPKRVYAGSGEGNFYANLGAGVYKSTDGGTTWAVLASAPFVGLGFYDLVLDPKTPSILYAATTNGFYKSTNSGSTWSLKRAGRCWDASVNPNGGTVELLAAFQDGLFASTNGGNTFAAVTLPSGPTAAWTRLAVDRVTAAPDIAYAFGAAGGAAHLWRRSGTTWTKITVPSTLSVNQAWYDWYVAATPDKKNQVYIGAIDTLRGDLSGSTWRWTNITTQGANSIHPDQHCLTFAPGNSKIIYAGNDGGIYRSTNTGGKWADLNKGLAITEIEYMASDPNTSKWLMAGTQDNGTIRFTGATKWDHIADGDGGDCGVDQQNSNTVYHSFYNVTLERSNNKGNTWTWLAPPNVASLFYPPVEVVGLTVGIGAVSLVVTRNGGPPWATVPLGLSSGEVSTAMRAIDANTLLIGTNGGRILKMAWTGTAWNKTTLTSPAAKYISCVAIDPSNPQRFWVTSTQVTGAGGRVYRSDNGGTSWVNCTAGLPNIPINSVVVDPANFKRVWVAADVGVYQTLDLGASWAAFLNGLPNAMAVDLLFHRQDRRLICGTRNRGAWVVDVP
jgi:photosystem II stability/assembly factor-like uncharacterized protein